MPLFVEGQDPLSPVPGYGPPPVPAAPDPLYKPPLDQIFGAAFRQMNPIVSVVSAINSASPDSTPDPNWNPRTIIGGTSYKGRPLEDFLGEVNESQTRAHMAKIDAEEHDRQMLAASGVAGTVASVAAGFTDPFAYIPVVGELSKGLSVARSVARTGAALAATGAISTAASEAVLRASQQTRTNEESIGNIASGTLLMGILGSAMGAFTRGEARAAARTFDTVRRDFVPPPLGVAPEEAMMAGGRAERAAERDMSPPPPPDAAEVMGRMYFDPEAEAPAPPPTIESEGPRISVGEPAAEIPSAPRAEPRAAPAAVESEGPRIPGEPAPEVPAATRAAEDRVTIPDEADNHLAAIFKSEHYDGSRVPLANAGLSGEEIERLHRAGLADSDGFMHAGQFARYERDRGAAERVGPVAHSEPVAPEQGMAAARAKGEPSPAAPEAPPTAEPTAPSSVETAAREMAANAKQALEDSGTEFDRLASEAITDHIEPLLDQAFPKSEPAPYKKQSEKVKAETLLAFIKRLGGIKDTGGDLKAADLIRGYPGLVNNKRGMDLDQAREAAAEAGYLGANTGQAMAGTRAADLLNALANHPTYSIHDIPEVARATTAREENARHVRVERASQDIDRHLSELGEKPLDHEMRSTAAEILLEQEHPNIDAAIESAAWRLVQEDVEHARVHREEPQFPELDFDFTPSYESARGETQPGPYFGDGPRAASDAGAARREIQPAGGNRAEDQAATEQVATEAGPEGTQQILLPGVSAVTDADRIIARAETPLRGGSAPPPEGGLFDQAVRLQRDLFDAGVPDKEKVQALMDFDRAMSESAAVRDMLEPDRTFGAPTRPPGPGAAGAAPSDVRVLKLKNFGVPEWLKGVPYAGPGAQAVGRLLNKLTPTLRVASTESVQGKRMMFDMAETSLLFEDHAHGITTSYNGPPLDRLIKTQSHQLLMATNYHLEHEFIAYRYGDTPPRFAPVERSVYEDLRGQAGGKMSFAQFKGAVSEALYSGDKSPIPQVEMAAQHIRRDVIDPVARYAQSVKGPDGRPMLAEELGPPAGDKSYAPRVWNKIALAARRNDANRIFTDWLETEQNTKAAAKDRLIDLQFRHDDIARNAARMDRKLSVFEKRIAETDQALKERGMETNRATDRADTLDEGNEKIDDDSNELRQVLAETRKSFSGTTVSPEERAAYDNLRRELANLDRQRARGGVRRDEAGIPVSASQSRFMDLADRKARYEMMRDVLTQARANEEATRLVIREKMEDEINNWQGNTSREAKTALAARAEAERVRGLKQQAGVYQGKGERLTGADAAVDKAVANVIASDRNLTREDLSRLSDEIINRLMGSPDGRLSYDTKPIVGPPEFTAGQEVRGHLRGREFAIPSLLVKGFIEDDTQHLMASYVRSILPDVMLTQRFGDIEMREGFRKLDEEYAARAAGMRDRKQLLALEAERQGVIRDLAATRDRLRGVYGWTGDVSQRNAARIAAVARSWNIVADLGTAPVNNLGDLGAGAVFRHGFMNVFQDSWTPMFKALTGNPTLAKAHREEFMAMGIGIDGLLGNMSRNFGDALANDRSGSKFERGLSWVTEKSMVVSGLTPMTDWSKTMAASVASNQLLKMAERVATGAELADDIEKLAAANIDRAMAVKIWDNFSNGGGAYIEGARVTNTGDWKNMDARQAFEAAIGREADIIVITPGMEKPLFFSRPMASLLLQFKSFTASAWEKLLISNIQQRDARTLQGLIVAVATGMLSYRLYTWLAGREASDNPADWVKEGVQRAGVLSWLMEANEAGAKLTAGSSDVWRLAGAKSPLTRRDQSPLGFLLGPTYSRLEGLAGASGDAIRAILPGDKPKVVWTAQDTHKLRQVMLFQNLMYVRRLFDMAEDGFNDAIGIPHRSKKARWNPTSQINAVQESTPPAPPQ